MRKRIISLVLALLLFAGLFPVAADAASMTYSDALVNYIKYGEGFSPTLYQDTGGWCIGYGCLVNPDDYPNGITEPEAEALLREKMDLLANEVRRFLGNYGVSVTQGQFDAMCSMTYNLGGYWLSAANTLPSMIINGAWNYSAEDIVSAFAAWCHVGGNVNKAILTRRIAEAKMFLYGDYSGNSAGWNWLVCSGNGGSVARKVNCYRSGTTYGTLPSATRSGYTLEGWLTDSGVLLTVDSTVSGNYFVSAKWRSNAEPTPTPTPEAIPTPEVSPEATPVPTPTPTPTPTAKPTPTPKKTASPTKKPTATKTSKPKNTPDPDKKQASEVTGNTITVDGKTYTFSKTMSVMITAYTHTGRKTSTGVWPDIGTVAVDPKVIPYGTKMYIPGYGFGVAQDTGVKGEHIDVFFDTENECIQFGRKRDRTIYILSD